MLHLTVRLRVPSSVSVKKCSLINTWFMGYDVQQGLVFSIYFLGFLCLSGSCLSES